MAQNSYLLRVKKKKITKKTVVLKAVCPTTQNKTCRTPIPVSGREDPREKTDAGEMAKHSKTRIKKEK